MSRIARRGVSLVVLSAALVLVPVGIGAAWYAIRSPASVLPDTALRVALLRAGLGAEALAASVVTAQETSALVAAFADSMASQPGALEQADATWAAARITKEAVEQKVASGLATPQEVAALIDAKAALASAENARTLLLDGWLQSATANLSAAKQSTLAMLRENQSWALPIEFLVKERQQSEWIAIRDALSNERIAPKYGDQPDQAQQAALATWRAEAPVAAAKSASTANLTAVESAWDSATGG
jgi:hypothetical protein